jgi:pimeloyl-ACP methyl ester carboxylesterase
VNARVSLVVVVGFVVVAGAGCFDLDSFVWNPTHCSNNTDELCEQKELCTACGDDLPFEKWGIPPANATREPITLDDGETNDAWFIASNGGPLADVTIVFSHGNFGGIEHYLNRVGMLFRTGANVYAVDYRGFGQSSDESEPTEAQFLDDTHAARDGLPAVLAAHGVSPEKIVLMGYSAGALSAVEMGVSDDSCGMVLEAPWPSVQAFADDSTFIGVPGSFVTTGTWDNISKMQRYDRPYLHFHGTEDQTVRIELGQELFDGAPSDDKAFIAVEGAAHGNFLGKEGDVPDVPAVLGEDAYVEAIAGFLDGLVCR